MNLKNIVGEIKEKIDSEAVKSKILNDRGIKLRNGKCACWIHSSNADTVMSFDSKGKRFKCFSCGNSVDIFSHYQEYYNLSFIEAVKSIARDFNLNVDIIIKESDRKPVKAPTIHKRATSIYSYLSKRGISQKTCDYVDIKQNNNMICFEYRNELGNHVANKYRLTKKADIDKLGMKMYFEKGTNINTLFNMDRIDATKPLIITEGEIDCLSLIEANILNCVSVPTGVNSEEWVKVNYSFLEQFEEVILWFDNDDAGIKGANKIHNRLPNPSVKIARCENSISDINELLVKEGKEAIYNVLEKARSPLIQGVSTLDMIEDVDIFDMGKIETGFYDMDKTILGITFGSLVTFTGRPGEGKSTIINQVFIGEPISQNEKTFLYSGELMSSNVKYWLLHTLGNEKDFVDYTDRYGGKYKRLSIKSKQIMTEKLLDKAYIHTDEIHDYKDMLKKMEVLYKRFGVRVHILDNLMTIEDDEESDEYKAQLNIIKAFKNFAKVNNCIVVIVAHPRKVDGRELVATDINGTGKIINLSDYIFKIERKFEDDREYDADFALIKNRPTGKNIAMKLKFDNDRKRFYSSNEKIELNKDYLEIKSHQDMFELVDGEF